MDLLSLNIGENLSTQVKKYWDFSDEGELIVVDSDNNKSHFKKVITQIKDLTPGRRRFDCGFLNDSGILVRDSNKIRNNDRYFLFISAEKGMIDFSVDPIKESNIKIKPILKKDGTMSGAVIWLNKGQNFSFKILGECPRIVVLKYCTLTHTLHVECRVEEVSKVELKLSFKQRLLMRLVHIFWPELKGGNLKI